MVLSKKLFYQIFLIHDVKNNYYVPLIFFLLPNKTSDTYMYTKAFRLIQNYLDPDMRTLKEPFMKRSLKYGLSSSTKTTFWL